MKRVLIFEDNAINAMDLRQRLDSLGYQVVAILPSAIDALKEIQHFSPDLVLMDISLGGEPDGIEVAGHIARQFEVPIVFATALSDEETIQRAQSCNPSGYIVKPFNTAIIEATLTTALKLGELRRKEKEAGDKLRKENELYSALLEIYEPMLRSDISLPETASVILEWALKVCRSTRGSVSLVDRETGMFRVHAAQDMGGERQDSITLGKAGQQAPGLKGRILVVEDNPVNQKLMMAILAQFGCTTRLAASGEEALEITARENFDLAFMDINLPGIDGIETTRQIRVQSSAGQNRRVSDRHLPIVALTAHAMRGDQERFIAAGMDDVIFKPVEIAKLKLVLEKFIEVPDSDATVPGPSPGSPVPVIPAMEYDLAKVAAAIAISVEDLREIALVFFDQLVQPYLDDLERAIQAKEKEAIRTAAHKLRGAVANLRLGHCVDELTLMENAAAGPVDFDYHTSFLRLKLMLQSIEGTVRASAVQINNEAAGINP